MTPDAIPRSPADLQQELAQSLEEVRALSEVSQVISASLDLREVLSSIAGHAVRLSRSDACGIYEFNQDRQAFEVLAAHNVSRKFDEAILSLQVDPREGVIGQAIQGGQPVQVPNVAEVSDFPFRELLLEEGFHALLAVPMGGERTIRGMVLYRKVSGPFDERTVNLVTALASQSKIAMENARLFTAVQEQSRNLEQLYRLSVSIQAALALPERLQLILKAVQDVIGFDRAIVWLPDREEANLEIGASIGMGDHLPPARIPIGAVRSLEKPFREQVEVIFDRDQDVPLEYRLPPEYARMAFFRSTSFAILPLVSRGKAVGLLGVDNRVSHEPLARNLEILRMFASDAAVAIENARLFQDVQAQRIQLEDLSRNLEQLYRLSSAVQEPLSLKEQLSRVLDAARQVVLIDRFYIWAINAGGDTLVNLAGAGFTEEEWKDFEGAEIPLVEGGAMYKAYREGVPLVFNDQNPLPPELRLKPPYSGLKAIRTKSFLVLPMIARGRPVGVLTGDNKRSGTPILPHTIDLLNTFASHAAVAIENSRLFQEIEDKSRKLESASRHKSEFLANMSHELRTPLNAILGFNEMILAGIYGDVPADLQVPLTDIQNSGKHLLRLINNVLDVAKIEAGRMELSLGEYSVQDMVESVRTSLRPLAADRGLEFAATVSEDIPLAYGDGGRITQCLMNLAANALKFTRQGRVEISADLQGNLLVYRVADTGIGIAPDKLETVFTEFRQGDASIASEFGGTGLGLSITKTFVEMHGGRIWAESEVGKGSRFFFAIPLRVSEGKLA